MSNETTNKDRFLSVFRNEWEMYRTRETTPRTTADKPADTPATFDVSPAAGELRIFADFPEPVTGLLLGVSDDGWRVLPLSPFTVPASDREILVGTRVYQLWNTCDLSFKTVSHSWIVEKLPPDDIADVKSALRVMRGEKVDDDLASCMGLPITALDDDPRRDYERTFRLSPPTAAPAQRSKWRYWVPALAASLLLALGLSFMLNQEKTHRQECIHIDNVSQVTAKVALKGEVQPPQCDVAMEMECPAPLAAESKGVKVANVDAMMSIKSPVVMKSVMGSARAAGVRGCYMSEEKLRRKRVLASNEPWHDSGWTRDALSDQAQSAQRADAVGTERFASFKENEFLEVTGNPLSTFGLDVDTASYTTMRRYLTDMKRLPPKDSVRIEEYVNYFSYDYAGPTGNVPVAVACELGACPWNASHKLLRVAVQAKRVPKEAIPPCNLVFLIDKSGSMSCNGGFTTLIQALRLLVDQLRPEDSVAIVTYASGVQVELPATSGSDKARIRQVLDGLRAGGATSGGEGLQLAYDQAMKNFSAKKNNRVVLVTDGDFNVGISNPSELERYIAEKRATGVFLTVLGVGYGNYQDAMMKKLANAGNGNYAFLDGILEAKKVLMTEFGGTMMTVAKDVKLQLEFNPAQVGAYRLLGYENRLLAAKDFNDDKKDAGEMGSGHSMTAFYELVPAGATNTVAKTDALKYQKQVPVANEELLTVKLRYKLPEADTSTRIDQPVVAKDITPAEPSESFRFASSVVEFALLMKDSSFKGSASFDSVIKRARAAKGADTDGWRAEFIRLVETAQLLQDSQPSTPAPRRNPVNDPDIQVDPGL